MMSPDKRRAMGMPALELIEEAAALLKGAPYALLIYYAASVPFVLALLFYWAEMSSSATASDWVSVGALGLAFFFVVMKTGQARFASALQGQLVPEMDEPWTPRRWMRCAVIQGIWQPWGLLAIPCAALVTLPFPFTYAFFQNLLITGSGSKRWREAAQSAWKLAGFWQKQNFMALTILSLFGLVVYLNGWILILLIPSMVKTLLGIKSVFTETGYSLFNTTFFAATICFAYLILDPLFKAVQVLRTFYAESRNTGADLQAGLSKVFQPALVICILAMLLAVPVSAKAQEQPVESAEAPVAVVPPPKLDETIKEVLDRREYRWRLPPVEVKQEQGERGAISKFIDDLLNGIRNMFRSVIRWFDNLVKEIQEFLDSLTGKKKPREEAESGSADFSSSRTMAIALLALVVIALVVFLVRYFLRRRVDKVAANVYTGVVKAPNLEDEQLLASELPEDEWLKLGDEMARRGERRLALRAYYLAVLARLSSKELLTVVPYKTNRDYARELKRRARGRDDLLGAFGTVMSIFECVWYGEHKAEDELWSQFEANRRILFVPTEEPLHVG